MLIVGPRALALTRGQKDGAKWCKVGQPPKLLQSLKIYLDTVFISYLVILAHFEVGGARWCKMVLPPKSHKYSRNMSRYRF